MRSRCAELQQHSFRAQESRHKCFIARATGLLLALFRLGRHKLQQPVSNDGCDTQAASDPVSLPKVNKHITVSRALLQLQICNQGPHLPGQVLRNAGHMQSLGKPCYKTDSAAQCCHTDCPPERVTWPSAWPPSVFTADESMSCFGGDCCSHPVPHFQIMWPTHNSESWCHAMLTCTGCRAVQCGRHHDADAGSCVQDGALRLGLIHCKGLLADADHLPLHVRIFNSTWPRHRGACLSYVGIIVWLSCSISTETGCSDVAKGTMCMHCCGMPMDEMSHALGQPHLCAQMVQLQYVSGAHQHPTSGPALPALFNNMLA